MSQLIPRTETSDYRYLVAVLPKDAEDFNLIHFTSDRYYSITFFNPEWNCLQLGYLKEPELLGTLSEITEEQAREIVPYNVSKEYEDIFNPLESLKSLVESKGVDMDKQIVILKVKI
jgi:hypothetical protein